MSAFALVQTSDRNIQQIQQNIANAINPILNNPIVTGIILTSVSLQAGPNQISHGLGRNLQGWMIVRKRAAGDIFDTQDSNSNPSKTLNLVAANAVTVDIYCF